MTRTIKTVFFKPGSLTEWVRVNTSTDANRAVAQCVYFMQIDRYGANVAEVFDEEHGELHAVVKRNTTGITIVYKRDPQKHEVKYAVSHLLKGT